MQLTRPVAAFTPDGVALLKDWRLVPVQRTGDWAEMVGMTEQAVGLDRALEVGTYGELPVARRDIPAPLLFKPRDQRLEQKTVAVNQKGKSARPGAENEPDFRFDLGNQGPVRIASRCFMKLMLVMMLNRVRNPFVLDRQSGTGTGRRAVVGSRDRSERSPHRVRVVIDGDLPVAAGACRVSDIRDTRPRVLEW